MTSPVFWWGGRRFILGVLCAIAAGSAPTANIRAPFSDRSAAMVRNFPRTIPISGESGGTARLMAKMPRSVEGPLCWRRCLKNRYPNPGSIDRPAQTLNVIPYRKTRDAGIRDKCGGLEPVRLNRDVPTLLSLKNKRHALRSWGGFAERIMPSS